MIFNARSEKYAATVTRLEPVSAACPLSASLVSSQDTPKSRANIRPMAIPKSRKEIIGIVLLPDTVIGLRIELLSGEVNLSVTFKSKSHHRPPSVHSARRGLISRLPITDKAGKEILIRSHRWSDCSVSLLSWPFSFRTLRATSGRMHHEVTRPFRLGGSLVERRNEGALTVDLSVAAREDQIQPRS